MTCLRQNSGATRSFAARLKNSAGPNASGQNDQGFAIAVRPPGEPAWARRLSREDFGDIGCVGEFPIAGIRCGAKSRPALPVEVMASPA
jgi:hypothetical protein